MATTTLDYVILCGFGFLIIAWFSAVFTVKRRHRRAHPQGDVDFVLQIFTIFLLLMFIKTIYLSLPRISTMALLPSQMDVIYPFVTVSYPSSARVGETVEVVVETSTFLLYSTLDVSFVNPRNGDVMDQLSLATMPGETGHKNFVETMPDEDFALVIRAQHSESLSELRATITIKETSMDTIILLLIGLVVATSLFVFVAKGE